MREGGIERRGEVEIRSKGETEVYIINKIVIITTKMSTTCMQLADKFYYISVLDRRKEVHISSTHKMHTS